MNEINKNTPISAGPKGVGGWLRFFCVSLTIFTPFVNLGDMGLNWRQAKPALEQFPSLEIVLYWETFGVAVILVYGFIVGCIIWSGSPSGREIAKTYLLIGLFGTIGINFIGIAIIFHIIPTIPTEAVTEMMSEVIKAIFKPTVFFLIWWFYFKKSKRVRNTYEEAESRQSVKVDFGEE